MSSLSSCLGYATGPVVGPVVVLRRCPALPLAGAGSTVGAERLSFRVRDGSGRFPFAVAAATSVVLWWWLVVSGL